MNHQQRSYSGHQTSSSTAATRRMVDVIGTESLLEDNLGDTSSASDSDDPISLYDESEDDVMDPSSSQFKHSASFGNGGHGSSGYDGDRKRASASTTSRETSSLWSVDSEERAVTHTKLMFLSCLLLTTIAMSVVVYYLVRKEELDDFRTEFNNVAGELLSVCNSNVGKVLGSLEGLATTTTSLVKQQGNEHHYVTIPDVEAHLLSARNLSGALTVAFLPKVYDLDSWSEYSVRNQGWIDEAHDVPINTSEPIFPYVWKEVNENYPTPPPTSSPVSTGSTSLGGIPSGASFSDVGYDPSLSAGGIRRQRQRRRQRRTQDDGEHHAMDGHQQQQQQQQSEDENKYVRVRFNGTDDDEYHIVDKTGRRYYTPVWQVSPTPPVDDTTLINYNLLYRNIFVQGAELIDETKEATFLDLCNQAAWFHIDIYAEVLQTVVIFPVLDKFYPTREIKREKGTVVGYFVATMSLGLFFEDVLADTTHPIHLVIKSTCGDVVTYLVEGTNVTMVSDKLDIHDPRYDDMGKFKELSPFEYKKFAADSYKGVCEYNATVYPTREKEETYLTRVPMYYTLVVISIFLFTSMGFIFFDMVVQRRQDKVMTTARKQDVIVSSLFPKNIQAKIMAEVDEEHNRLSHVGKAGLKSYLINDSVGFDGGGNGNRCTSNANGKSNGGNGTKSTSKSTKSGNGGIVSATTALDKSKPIADLFPETTIMFGDIAGFTAWSSTREPSQVFTLLETIYHEFDMIAKRRRVFKVEVVGDCYVAVCGLPDPRDDHAVVMAKFANECLMKMHTLTRQLEVALGPDTNELVLRVGLHSGPVVAGVLRGEKSRFQLFGDTVNTASRMESTGIPDRVQMSQETADLLMIAGKPHWCIPRKDMVTAKGKGELQTYFLKQVGSNSDRRNSGMRSSICSDGDNSTAGTSMTSTGEYSGPIDSAEAVDKRNRLADWTVEVMTCLLKEIIARRVACRIKGDSKTKMDSLERPYRDASTATTSSTTSTSTTFEITGKHVGNERTVIDEVEEIIMLPERDEAAAKRELQSDPNEIALSQDVFEELREYVRTIASLYNDNAFHNFAHATHVTMSVVKLLSRIVAPDLEEVKDTTLHDHTYGITSDPLTRFAVVLSALIHDVDHTGVSNAQLVKEKKPVATYYKNKSVAEQNSVDLAWDLLMEPQYENLRRQIYTTEAEFKRFRKLVVNSVMATDILDKDLKKLRNDRWDVAFDVSRSEEEKTSRSAVNRKATIVIEHLIQASDVAHTMQHWHIYRKWNERLFREMYKAYEVGRLDKDPSENWYKGEIGFFDFYIIPLAKKLKECGVFGVSSDEYLIYAQQNRKEWERRGEGIVAQMIESVKRRKFAEKVMSIQQEMVDKEGEQIIAEMAAAMKLVPLTKFKRASSDSTERSRRSSLPSPGAGRRHSSKPLPLDPFHLDESHKSDSQLNLPDWSYSNTEEEDGDDNDNNIGKVITPSLSSQGKNNEAKEQDHAGPSVSKTGTNSSAYQQQQQKPPPPEMAPPIASPQILGFYDSCSEDFMIPLK